MTQISVLGAGAFGTALAVALSQQSEAQVTLWGRDADLISAMRTARENTARLPGVVLPDHLRLTSDLEEACKATLILVAVPMKVISALTVFLKYRIKKQKIILCAKGIDPDSNLLPTALFAQSYGEADLAVLSGPSFAADIGRGKPTALVLATQSDGGPDMQKTLSGNTLRLYLTDDVVGTELGGALKNVVAIGAGVAMGLGLGESARAALITRGFAEMARFAATQGARPETLYGLSGFGDLLLTATSEKSRNYRYGIAVGKGKRDVTETVEGRNTALALKGKSDAYPTLATIAEVLHGRLDPLEAMQHLMQRPLGVE